MLTPYRTLLIMDEQPNLPLIHEIVEQIRLQSPHGEISEEVQNKIEMQCLIMDLEYIAEMIKNIEIPGKFVKWFQSLLFNLREEDGDEFDRDEASISWLTADRAITIPRGAALGIDLPDRDMP